MNLPKNPRSLVKTALAAVLAGVFISLLVFRAILFEAEFVPPIFIAPPAVAVSYHSELPPFKAAPGIARHVLIISVDGMRPDGITTAQAPNLLSLMQRGAYASHAETIRPSITLPSHTAMLTGLDFKNHGVVWNNYRPGHIAHPTVFSVAKDAGLSTAMLFAKDKFHFLANPEQVHWIYGPGIPKVIPTLEDVTRPDFKENTGPDPSAPPKDAASTRTATLPKPDPVAKATAGNPKPTTSADGLARAFQGEWPEAKYQLTFVHFGEPDGAGHGRGWMGHAYLEAILKVDAAIGKILQTLKESGEEDATAIIVTADHGGSGRQHFLRAQPDAPENVLIPWICVGPGVRAGTVIRRTLHTMDTTPTALRFLGLPAPEGIDGKVVEEVFPGAKH